MDKYTRIPNDILEAMYAAGLTKGQTNVLLYILRKTLGWRKKKDAISITRMAKETHMRKQTVMDSVNALEKRQIIGIERRPGHPSLMWVQGVRKWLPVTETVPLTETVPQYTRKPCMQGVTETVPTKEILKETVIKKNIDFVPESDDDDDDGWHVYTEEEKAELRKEGYLI